MGFITDFLLGSEGSIDWDELRKLMNYDANLNRTDRQGMFTGWEWERDPDGNPTGNQVQTINPAFQDAVNRLGFNASKADDPYTSPGQFSTMLDAKMSKESERLGIPSGSSPPSSERAGRFAQAYLPPAPSSAGGNQNFTGGWNRLDPVDYAPGTSPQEIKEADPLFGKPPDYYNDKGNIRRKYRPDNRNYIGDDFLARYEDDPDYQFRADDPNNPSEWYNRQGNLRKQYRVGG